MYKYVQFRLIIQFRIFMYNLGYLSEIQDNLGQLGTIRDNKGQLWKIINNKDNFGKMDKE